MVTLSLGSWSTMLKSRTVGQARPVPARPRSRPSSARSRRTTMTAALRAPRRRPPSRTPGRCRTTPARRASPLAVGTLTLASAPGVAPAWRSVAPSNPMSIVTTTCAAASAPPARRQLSPLGDHQGVVHRQGPGSRVQDSGLDECPQVDQLIIWQPESRGRGAGPSELVRRGQPLRGQRVRRDDDVAVGVGGRGRDALRGRSRGLVDLGRAAARGGDEDPDAQAQRHRRGDRDRDTGRAITPAATAAYGRLTGNKH